MHHATYRRNGRTGFGEGQTPELAQRAAIVDWNDQPALEAPFRPGTSWIVGGIAAICTALVGVVFLVTA